VREGKISSLATTKAEFEASLVSSGPALSREFSTCTLATTLHGFFPTLTPMFA
jgi:hypothetical protein